MTFAPVRSEGAGMLPRLSAKWVDKAATYRCRYEQYDANCVVSWDCIGTAKMIHILTLLFRLNGQYEV